MIKLFREKVSLQIASHLRKGELLHHPISRCLFNPILLQRMAEETLWNSLLTSGVLFLKPAVLEPISWRKEAVWIFEMQKSVQKQPVHSQFAIFSLSLNDIWICCQIKLTWEKVLLCEKLATSEWKTHGTIWSLTVPFTFMNCFSFNLFIFLEISKVSYLQSWLWKN